MNFHATAESNFQRWFDVSVWCGILYNQSINQLNFGSRLNDFYLRIVALLDDLRLVA
jgi:hypothetical protein